MKVALIIGVLMGITPIAHAQPGRGDDGDRHDLVGGISSAQPAGTKQPEVPLAAIDLAHEDTIAVAPVVGQLRSVRLNAIGGGAYVDSIELRFGDNTTQHIAVRHQLARDESADIDLNGKRGLQAITVRGTPDENGRIQVIGLR